PPQERLERRRALERLLEREAEDARDGVLHSFAARRQRDLPSRQRLHRARRDLERRALAEPEEHHRDRAERVPLGDVEAVAGWPVLGGPVGPAQRARDLEARLRGEVLQEIGGGDVPELEERLAELLVLVAGALERLLVDFLGDDAAEDEEVPEHLAALVRG